MITAQLATIPERIECLEIVIKSLYNQVDRLNIICNGHTDKDLERFIGMPIGDKVIFYRRNNQMTDGEKYYNIENCEPGYIFTCDDDLQYSENYVQHMINKIEQYERKAVVTLHGRVWSDIPIYSFYRDRKEGINIPGGGMFRCTEQVIGDHRVHCGGDGVMAWHTDTLKMRYEYVELPNMSQLWMALVCNRLGIPQIVVEHDEFMVEAIWDGPGIWDKENQNDGMQTRLINERWITDEKREYYLKNSGE